jgi:hypothetical protein
MVGNPGSIVRCRNRDWVLMPSESDAVHLLRPLTGAMDDVVAINRRIADLVGYSLPEERVRPATFPLPTPDDLSDAVGAHLLWQAARLTLRDGATPFRSLGRVSIRPRIYQFVPLLMALRLDPIRLLIADDVGVGKTIEALLIAREMLDRGHPLGYRRPARSAQAGLGQHLSPFPDPSRQHRFRQERPQPAPFPARMPGIRHRRRGARRRRRDRRQRQPAAAASSAARDCRKRRPPPRAADRHSAQRDRGCLPFAAGAPAAQIRGVEHWRPQRGAAHRACPSFRAAHAPRHQAGLGRSRLFPRARSRRPDLPTLAGLSNLVRQDLRFLLRNRSVRRGSRQMAAAGPLLGRSRLATLGDVEPRGGRGCPRKPPQGPADHRRGDRFQPVRLRIGRRPDRCRPADPTARGGGDHARQQRPAETSGSRTPRPFAAPFSGRYEAGGMCEAGRGFAAPRLSADRMVPLHRHG